ALSGLSVTADEPTLADPNVDLIDTPTWQLITDLDSDAFRVRQHSKQKIRSRLEAPADDQEIIRCLQFAQQHGSVEMQLQAGRWLRTREWIRLNQSLRRLLDSPDDVRADELPLWHQFSSVIGDSQFARAFYADVARRYYHGMARQSEWIDGGLDPSGQLLRSNRLSPMHLSRHDAVAWSYALLSDQVLPRHVPSTRSRGIASALQSDSLSPQPISIRDRMALQALVESWIALHPSWLRPADRIRVALKFQCHELAGLISDQTLAHSAATDVATALLARQALWEQGILVEDAASWRDDLRRWVSDRRRLERLPNDRMRPGPTTRVSDVAAAILLHQQGLNLRDYGYRTLRADRYLIYNPSSLAIASPAQRRQAIEQALE
ncbi:MAG: hypothetical protein AAGA03_15570, partial [Planctomycetota bacterium]